MAAKPKAKPKAVVFGVNDGGEFALSSDGMWTLRFEPTTKRIVFKCAGTDVWSLDAVGNVRLHGTNSGRQKTV